MASTSNVIILGVNGHEYAHIKGKNKNKPFFETKWQAYRVYAEGFVRMKINGLERTSDAEVIIYDECCIAPYDNPRNIDYSASAFVADIWIGKQMANAYERKHLSWSNVGGWLQSIGKYLPILLVAGVVGIAFIIQAFS